jgi:hypothetical protein
LRPSAEREELRSYTVWLANYLRYIKSHGDTKGRSISFQDFSVRWEYVSSGYVNMATVKGVGREWMRDASPEHQQKLKEQAAFIIVRAPVVREEIASIEPSETLELVVDDFGVYAQRFIDEDGIARIHKGVGTHSPGLTESALAMMQDFYTAIQKGIPMQGAPGLTLSTPPRELQHLPPAMNPY